VAEWLRAVPGKPGTFRTDGVGRDRDLDFVPFYKLHRREYGVYWDLFTPEEWAKVAADHLAEEEARRALEAATVGFAQPGEMQPETDFNFQGEEAQVVRVLERAGRRGKKWFSFDLPVDEAHPMALIVTYAFEEREARKFEILVDGIRVGEETVDRRTPDREPRLYDVRYAIPAESVRGKTKLTVRFQASEGSQIAPVCGIRTIRADAAGLRG
jgi:hypothetical protein